jgi:hypothetical protein
MRQLFAGIAAETPWEWAKGKRRVFTSPIKEVMIALLSAVVTASVAFYVGDQDWRQSLLIAAVTGVLVALIPPQVETLWWRLRRDTILLEEQRTENARLLGERDERQREDRQREMRQEKERESQLPPSEPPRHLIGYPAPVKTFTPSQPLADTLARAERVLANFKLSSELTPTPKAKANDATAPLRVEVMLQANVGGTPGMVIKAVNRAPETVLDAVVKVRDLRRWDADMNAFVMAPDTHPNGVFTELALGKRTLHPGVPEQIGFAHAGDESVRIDGAGTHCRITVPSPRLLSYRVEGVDGRSCSGVVCFEWKGSGTLPQPIACPPHHAPAKVVSSAPPPPTTL